MDNKPLILVAMRNGGENGGPYVSHKRIMESSLNHKYDFRCILTPRARNLINPFGMHKLVKEIRSNNPDLVQVAGLQLEGFFTMIACKLAKVKTVLAIHGSVCESLSINRVKKFLFYLLEKFTVNSADIVYGVSDYVSSWKICKKNNYFGTIYNITNFSNFSNISVREKMNFSDDDIVIVSTGRINIEKGYDILWETIKKIGKNNNFKYVIAGEGDYKKEFQKNIVDNGYEDKVFLVGFLDDVSTILNGADIFVICTKHETLCISLLEAANAGLPLIASNVGGIPEIIDDGKEGYLISELTADEFAKKIVYLSNNKKIRDKMGKNAKIKLDKKFSENNITSKLDELYSKILEKNVKKEN